MSSEEEVPSQQRNAPKDSPAWQQLVQYVKADGRDSEALRDLLAHIQAHPGLPAFPQICHNLREAIQAMQQQWGDAVLSPFGLLSWLPMLDWVIENQIQLSQAIGSFQIAEAKKEQALAGKGFVRFPLYSALYNRQSDRERRRRYSLLQGQVVVAHFLLLKDSTRADYEAYSDEKRFPAIPDSFYRVTLILRRLSLRRWASYLDQLPVEQPPEAFARKLQDTQRPAYDKDLLKWHEKLTIFFQRLYGGPKRPGKGRPRGGNRNGGSRWIPGHIEITPQILEAELPLGDADDPDFDWADEVCFSYLRLNSNEQQERWACDDDPTEGEEERSVHLFDYGREGKEMGVGNFAAASWSQLQQRAKANQLLPWAYGTLAAQELRALLTGAAAWLEEANTGNDVGKRQEASERLEIAVLLFTMLATNSSPERARRLRLFSAEQSRDAELALLTLPEGQMWRLPALVPEYARAHTRSANEVKPSDYVFLPDITGSGHWVREHWRQQTAKRTSREAGIVFGHDLGWYRQKLRQLLAFPAANPTGRVTETKIAQFVFSRVLQVSRGDIAAAALVTGQPHPLARVRLYYASPSLSHLQRLYREAMHDLVMPPILPSHKQTGTVS